ncbi:MULTISPECIES: sigma-E factor negative regulatory protein [Dyella]|uniref:Anti-anti-sigma factor n=2 Tax=Dyella TaxID=231454 RepID=A0A4R0YW49_9GAMM|nr:MULTISPECIES: sigma-E factor negative regulatory protein [Dyella]TBR39667.1 anti-anti-sigma factor [Dyella terrae]TCI12751.1 anti-anti-sigma factor [Dyella soli]
MTDTQRENLSAGMDGELSAEELRFLLRRIDHDAALQHAWTRYHLVRDGVRGQVTPLATSGFSARVMLAIEQESGAVAGTGKRHWLRWSAGGAIAASVAVAALMVSQPVGPGAGHSGATSLTTASVTPSQDANANTITQSTSPAAAPPWLNQYTGLPSQLTQQAAATVDSGDSTYLYSRNPSNPYQIDRYRAINNGDGSYLLLLHPDQQSHQPASRQAVANQ